MHSAFNAFWRACTQLNSTSCFSNTELLDISPSISDPHVPINNNIRNQIVIFIVLFFFFSFIPFFHYSEQINSRIKWKLTNQIQNINIISVLRHNNSHNNFRNDSEYRDYETVFIIPGPSQMKNRKNIKINQKNNNNNNKICRVSFEFLTKCLWFLSLCPRLCFTFLLIIFVLDALRMRITSSVFSFWVLWFIFVYVLFRDF